MGSLEVNPLTVKLLDNALCVHVRDKTRKITILRVNDKSGRGGLVVVVPMFQIQGETIFPVLNISFKTFQNLKTNTSTNKFSKF